MQKILFLSMLFLMPLTKTTFSPYQINVNCVACPLSLPCAFCNHQTGGPYNTFSNYTCNQLCEVINDNKIYFQSCTVDSYQLKCSHCCYSIVMDMGDRLPKTCATKDMLKYCDIQTFQPQQTDNKQIDNEVIFGGQVLIVIFVIIIVADMCISMCWKKCKRNREFSVIKQEIVGNGIEHQDGKELTDQQYLTQHN